MVSSSKVENLAQRFAPYVEELQEFFRSRGLSYGSVTDLENFPAHLADPAFCEEMVSMVRSIVYRESEALPRTELMELVAIAVGGPHLDEAEPDLHGPLRQILNFVTEIVRPRRPGAMEELPPADLAVSPAAPGRSSPLLDLLYTEPAAPKAAAPRMAVAPEIAAAPFIEPPPTAVAPVRVAPDVPTPPALSVAPEVSVAHAVTEASPAAVVPAERASTNDRLSRALIDSEEQEKARAQVDEPVASVPAAQTSSPPVATSRAPRPAGLPPARERSTSISAFLRRAYWIPGVCVLLLAVAAVLLLQRKRPAAPQPAPIAAVAAESANLPKPSAYGPTLADARREERISSQPAEGSSAVPRSRSADVSTPPPSDGPLTPRGSAGPLLTAPTHRGSASVALASKVTPRILGGREGVFLASSGMMASHLINAPAPSYPKLASLTHVEGEVIVQVVVSRNGAVSATRVLEGPHLLRAAAEHAIRRWRYRPYLIDGRPTDVATIVTVNFRLSR